jgi:PHP family Zn ribbon phosphoesterase
MQVRIDLHNHSCLSPCANDDLLPSLLAFEAMEQGIEILALTDHNATENLRTFGQACEVCSIMPVFGMEVNTIEEVHLLVLFEAVDPAIEFGAWIQSTLPPLTNKPDRFGHQIICDGLGTTVEEFPLMLATASSLSFDEVVLRGLEAGALVIPAHIDRPSSSVLANLGFLPDLPYTALEMLRPTEQKWTVITASDAHSLGEVGTRSCTIELDEVSWEALKRGLSDQRNVRF